MVEIIHTATLVHDDIIDEAQTRRGRPAANTQWGNSKCVLAGDWLYMQAFKIAVQERNFRILDTLIELTQQMVEGELLQMEKLGKLISLDEHFDLIYPQDGLPVLGLHAAGSDSRRRQPRTKKKSGTVRARPGDGIPDRGRRARPDRFRKRAGETRGQRFARRQGHDGSDPCAGALHAAGTTAAFRLSCGRRAFKSVTHAQILEILERYGSLDAALTRALQYAELARNAICSFPDTEIKRALLWAPEFVVAREK